MGSSGKKKGVFETTVIANERIGHSFYRISLEFEGEGAKAFFEASAGQFAEFDLSNAPIPPAEFIPEGLSDSAGRKVLLRRPFSFADITGSEEKALVEVLYCVVGPASLRMAGLKAGDTISVMGPLGRGFQVPQGKTTALLVSGGMGAGPMQHLNNYLAEKYKHLRIVVFAGARAEKDLPFSPHSFARYKTETHLTTDDGSASAGVKGFVTDSLCRWLEKSEVPKDKMVIYSCGPEPMLARVAQIAIEAGIDCQVSMERRMACGIGLCQGCAVECKAGEQGETVYKMCCVDGPVFEGKEVVFEK